MKRILFNAAAMVVLSTAAFIPTQAVAQVGINIVIGNAPPPVRYEVVPAARRGYEWAPGYWNWNGQKHVWVRGHWERERVGQHYQHPEWQRNNDGWRLNRGGWERGERHDNRNGNGNGNRGKGHGDRDHDGVPNRHDYRPNDPRHN